VPAGDRLLQELKHVLQHLGVTNQSPLSHPVLARANLDASVEQVDALRDLEVAPRGVVQRLQVGVALEKARIRPRRIPAQRERTQKISGESSTEPTEEMFVRSRKSSPIFDMISAGD
jgi:hypothetical protein